MPRGRKQPALPPPEKSSLELLAEQIGHEFGKLADDVDRARTAAGVIRHEADKFAARLTQSDVPEPPGPRPADSENRKTRGGGRPKGKTDPLNPWDGHEWGCCGSRSHRRHKKDCTLLNSDGKLPPDDQPAPKSFGSKTTVGHACCGSNGRRHKANCTTRGPADRGGADASGEEKAWKCVNCSHVQRSIEKPEECEECPATVFVETGGWQ